MSWRKKNTDESLSSGPAWSTELAPGQPELLRETLFRAPSAPQGNRMRKDCVDGSGGRGYTSLFLQHQPDPTPPAGLRGHQHRWHTYTVILAYCVTVALSIAAVPMGECPCLCVTRLPSDCFLELSWSQVLASSLFSSPTRHADFLLTKKTTQVTEAPEANVIRDQSRP